MELSHEWNRRELDQHELNEAHRPMEDEYAFYNAVKDGDMEYVRENCAKGAFTDPEGMGILSRHSLMNIRYHYVITVALITRHCVEGGMELEQAYRLSDFYILKMDSCSSVSEIASLHNDMVLDFTGKMSLLKKKSIISRSIIQCTDYIYTHLHERITVDVLAEYTGLSASHLSRLFKKNLGLSISDYVREKKIEKAENLLKYSDYSYIEIANYLSFSSQSHFIQTFEKLTGMTPKKYRDKQYHTTW